MGVTGRLSVVQFVPSLLERPVVAVAFALTVALFVGNPVGPGDWARREAAAREVPPAAGEPLAAA